LTCGSGASGALEPFGEFSGAAAAMFGALELGGSALLGSVAMLFKVQSSLPMAYTMIITTTFALVLLVIFKRKYPNYGKLEKD
jgi:MFS transporter, DHA1 family, chloramphenicol/florfenicol resistance protein